MWNGINCSVADPGFEDNMFVALRYYFCKCLRNKTRRPIYVIYNIADITWNHILLQ